MSEIDTAEIRERARREIARTHGNHELAGYAIAAADEIERLRGYKAEKDSLVEQFHGAVAMWNAEKKRADEARAAALEKAIQIADKAVSIQRHFGTKEAADACEDVANQLRDLANSPTCEGVE